jgi:lipopolysaccharide transport system permease protein
MMNSPTLPHAATAEQEIVIEAGKTELHYWRDLWRYRELFYFLTWRDILVRYKQTVLGIAWAVLQPLLTTFAFTVLFGYLAKFPAPAPYPIWVFVAQLPWQFFSRAFGDAGNSLISNSNLVSKIYFPRLIVPASSVIAAMIDFLISAALLAVVMAFYRYAPDWRILTMPLFLLLALGAATGAGLWVAALNVSYRDFRYIVPFVMQMGMYVSPVGWSSDRVPEKWRFLYSLNPMVGVIDGFRWSICQGKAELYLPGLALSVLLVGAMLISGVIYFRATEKRFADVI